MSFQRKTVRRPGNVRDDHRIEQMVRVDHAGEYGAVRIYRGQRAVFANRASKARIAGQLQRMEADEQHHLDAFDDHIRAGLARPTLMGPLWDAAGYALGVATALMGERAAHACTEAVENVIEGHYGAQVEELRLMGEDALADQFAQFQAEEVEHRDLAVDEGARDAAGYPLLSAVITAGCHTAIAVTTRV